jgi:glycosidase
LRPDIPTDATWANFVRNHDELTLDKLSDAEREEVFEAFAPDESQRVYDRGITRRLPTMLGGDPRRIRMVYSLMFSLPGTPVLFYGEEIGMGENPEVGGRESVRTPMQWTDGRNGGFSTAAPRKLVAPQPADGYAPEHVNVRRQRNDEDSLLQFVRRLISRYRTSPEIGWGQFEAIEHDGAGVLVHGVRSELGRIVALHNFTDVPVRLRAELGAVEDGTELVDLHGPERIELDAKGRIECELAPYGFRWLRSSPPGDTRIG